MKPKTLQLLRKAGVRDLDLSSLSREKTLASAELLIQAVKACESMEHLEDLMGPVFKDIHDVECRRIAQSYRWTHTGPLDASGTEALVEAMKEDAKSWMDEVLPRLIEASDEAVERIEAA